MGEEGVGCVDDGVEKERRRYVAVAKGMWERRRMARVRRW